MIRQCHMKYIQLMLIVIIDSLYFCWTKILPDVAVPFGHGLLIESDISPRSVERSIDLDNEGTLQQAIVSKSATNKNKKPFYNAKSRNVINNNTIFTIYIKKSKKN
jgi:hypothetical protein